MIEKIGKWEGDNVNIFKCFCFGICKYYVV